MPPELKQHMMYPLAAWPALAIQLLKHIPRADLLSEVPLPWVFVEDYNIEPRMWCNSTCTMGVMHGADAVVEWVQTVVNWLRTANAAHGTTLGVALTLVHDKGLLLRISGGGGPSSYYIAFRAHETDRRPRLLGKPNSKVKRIQAVQVDLFGPSGIFLAVQSLRELPWPKESLKRQRPKSKTPHRSKLFVLEYDTMERTLMLRPYRVRPSSRFSLDFGPEFTQWDTEFKAKLQSTIGGVAILHGPPGGGKTTYIEDLIHQGVGSRRFVFMPSYLFQSLGDPPVMAELHRLMGQPTILMVEDAEALTQAQPDGQRSPATSMLLNLSDGLLGHIAQVTTILTVNCDPQELDPAITRSGRLITSRHFGPLTAHQITKIGQQLGWDELKMRQAQQHPMTIAELLAAHPIPSDDEQPPPPGTPPDVLPFPKR